MKSQIFLLMLLATTASAQTDTTAYPLTATVEGSHIAIQCDEMKGSSLCIPYLQISALINGRHLELQGGVAKDGILVLGDYKARLVSDQHKKQYHSNQLYELQYPDGSTEKFGVIGESK